MANRMVESIARYGGLCRDCADEAGICPTNGLPCDFSLKRKAIEHVLRGYAYYTDNPQFLFDIFGEEQA